MGSNGLEDDPDWVSALRSQDEAAFRQLVSRYHASMLQLARYLVGDSAPDVVQNSWIGAYQGLPKFKGDSTLRTWLLRITRNKAISHMRSTSRLASEANLDESDLFSRFDRNGHWQEPPAPWPNETPEALLARDELRQQIEHSITTLPQMQRTVLILRDMEGLSTSEVCKILDISASNCYVLLHRARTRVWSIINAYQGSGDDAQV